MGCDDMNENVIIMSVYIDQQDVDIIFHIILLSDIFISYSFPSSGLVVLLFFIGSNMLIKNKLQHIL